MTNQATASGMDSRTASLVDSERSGTDDSGTASLERDSVSTGGWRNADTNPGTDSGIAFSGSIASDSGSFGPDCLAADCLTNNGGIGPVRIVKAGKAKASEDVEMSEARAEGEGQMAQGKHLKKPKQETLGGRARYNKPKQMKGQRLAKYCDS